MDFIWMLIQLLFYLFLYILFWLFCLSPLILIFIFFRYNWFKRLSYFFASLRHGSRNILVCNYSSGFNYKYENDSPFYFDMIYYLIAKENCIKFYPLYSLKKSSYIPYEKIINILIEYNSKNNPPELPEHIRDVRHIYIRFTAEDGSEDILNVYMSSSDRFYAFNKYAMLKSNFFKQAARFVPIENFIISDYTAVESILKKWKN